MAKDASFDVVSKYDVADMINIADQVKRELATRYDFQGTGSEIEFDREKSELRLKSNSEIKLRAIKDVVESKFIRRSVDLKFLDNSQEITQSGMEYKWTLALKQGLDQEKAKQVSKIIRDQHPKVKSSIQGDAIRVVSASRDELQAVMQTLRTADLPFAVSFENFR
ncbi:YajQ family cyclic di-GMP-binding protein [bacterium]|nr:MAG: YajQ family cyclic di-GMP-binding protein [bacterium]